MSEYVKVEGDSVPTATAHMVGEPQVAYATAQPAAAQAFPGQEQQHHAPQAQAYPTQAYPTQAQPYPTQAQAYPPHAQAYAMPVQQQTTTTTTTSSTPMFVRRSCPALHTCGRPNQEAVAVLVPIESSGFAADTHPCVLHPFSALACRLELPFGWGCRSRPPSACGEVLTRRLCRGRCQSPPFVSDGACSAV
jgi:hypothetical protein